MPLIIESYFHPYTEILSVLFPDKSATYISSPISDVSNDLFYYTRQEISREIKYYFNKIYYLENGKIVCIDKNNRQIKYYDAIQGKLINFKEQEKQEQLDKTDFLPQLNAQSGELVLFPEEDDE